MPVRPQGRVPYGPLSSALSGGIMPVPMGAFEAEAQPLLERILSQMRQASKKPIPLEASFASWPLSEGGPSIEDEFNQTYSILNGYFQQLHGKSLEEILSENFKFAYPDVERGAKAGTSVRLIPIERSSRPDVMPTIDYAKSLMERLRGK